MSDDSEHECPECPPGLPGWMATFADLMSLLMCFFVLLLSFSEMDVLKFKRLAGSLREAFGVQQQINLNDIPKGTSIIAQEFSPGRPEPTPLDVVRQNTTDTDQQTLEVLCEAEVEKAKAESCTDGGGSQVQEIVIQKVQELVQQTEQQAVEVASQLEDAINKDIIEVETRGRKIVIRVQENSSFDSGSAELKDEFLPILDQLRDILSNVEGPILVEGHTDSIPINTPQFPSNWELSTARALQVAHGLFDFGGLDPSRFSVAGYADNKPLVPNDSVENRARNRRVDIIIQQPPSDELKQALEQQRAQSAESFAEQFGNDGFGNDGIGGDGFDFDGFQGLSPDEVF